MELLNRELEILEDYKNANTDVWRVVLAKAEVMTERVKKYTGDKHHFYNFVHVAWLRQCSVEDVFLHYITMKLSRMTASKVDHRDERYVDTVIDIANYADLKAAWILSGLTPEEIAPHLYEFAHNPYQYYAEIGKPVINVDYDGVLNEYAGWNGEYEEYAFREDAEELLSGLSEDFTIFICTANPEWRIQEVVIPQLIEAGLMKYVEYVTTTKAPGIILDDKAVQFHSAEQALDAVRNFKPHWAE